MNLDGYLVRHLTDIFIHAPMPVVWSKLIAINEWKHWQQDVQKGSMPKELGVGSLFTYSSRGKSYKAKITEFSYGTLLAWEGNSTFGSIAIEWVLKEAHNGTHVIIRAGSKSMLGGFLVQLRKKELKKHLITWTISLKSSCEN